MENASLCKRWLALAACALCCWAMMFVVLPTVNRVFPEMGKFGKLVEEENIRVGMFFYTDVEQAGVADWNIENTIRFMPHGGDQAAD